MSTFVIGVLRLLLGRVHSGCFLRCFEWSLSDPFRTFPGTISSRATTAYAPAAGLYPPFDPIRRAWPLHGPLPSWSTARSRASSWERCCWRPSRRAGPRASGRTCLRAPPRSACPSFLSAPGGPRRGNAPLALLLYAGAQPPPAWGEAHRTRASAHTPQPRSRAALSVFFILRRRKGEHNNNNRS